MATRVEELDWVNMCTELANYEARIGSYSGNSTLEIWDDDYPQRAPIVIDRERVEEARHYLAIARREFDTIWYDYCNKKRG